MFLLYNLKTFWLTGNFGVGIASFFVFARLVITVNIFVAILWTCFVIIPVAITYDSSDIVSVMYHDDEDDDTFTVRNLFDGRVSVYVLCVCVCVCVCLCLCLYMCVCVCMFIVIILSYIVAMPRRCISTLCCIFSFVQETIFSQIFNLSKICEQVL